jgi:hypothetical protein
MSSRLEGAELAFRVRFVDIPLEPLLAERTSAPSVQAEGAQRAKAHGRSEAQASWQGWVAPRIEVSAEPIAIEPAKDLALREIIRQADSGRVEVVLPLPKKKLSRGPIAIDLTKGHAAVVELEVSGARVSRKKTKGTIEPKIQLPLGLEFRGLYLDEHGEIIADVAGFPDINLSRWSSAVPQIPATLDKLLDLLFPEAQPKPDAKSEKKEKAEELDLSGLVVRARSVRPRCAEALDLGRLGRVMLGPNTALDVDYSAKELVVRGRAHVDGATFFGKGFRLDGVAAEGDAEWRLAGGEMTLEIGNAWARIDRATVHVGEGTLVLGPTTLDFRLSYGGARGPRFSVHASHASTSLERGDLVLSIGGVPAKVVLDPMQASGELRMVDEQVDFDVTVQGAGARIAEAKADLGLVSLDVHNLKARGDGRVFGSSDGRFAFSGLLEAKADVASSHVSLGALGATLAGGSSGTIRVTELSASPSKLEALIASADLRVRLASGSIPIGPSSVLRFSRGAEGALSLATIAVTADRRWPHLRGRIAVDAASDPVSIAGLLDIPEGQSHVEAELELDSRGHLTLSRMEMKLSAG